MKKIFWVLALLIWVSLSSQAQTYTVRGRVKIGAEPAAFSIVHLEKTNFGGLTDSLGNFKISKVPAGNYTLEASYTGYRRKVIRLQVSADTNVGVLVLKEAPVNTLNPVTISGTRNVISKKLSPIMVNVVGAQLLQSTQSAVVSEVLNFSPGLRLENNCQNCGFTSLRLNGLDGPYTQILLNGRPVFSALSTVYGLEQIPAAMVDRIEVVRGGGSVVYGGNAIAGTVNIITKKPKENLWEFSSNTALIGGRTIDQTLSANASIVSDDFKSGLSVFGLSRNRGWYDHNNDGFSEITKLQNLSLGGSGYVITEKGHQWDFNAQGIQEFRRGGNKFDLEPHQTDITEQIQTRNLGFGTTFTAAGLPSKQGLSAYGAFNYTDRGSYYGGGGRVLSPTDTLTATDILAINAYGNSEDYSFVTGTEFSISEWFKNFTFQTGAEARGSSVTDKMPGYGRSIKQQAITYGAFVQGIYFRGSAFTVTGGLRFDLPTVKGVYDYSDTVLNNGLKFYPVVVPRLTMMYRPTTDLSLRATFAQGYRAPQAFDEDLHIETVGGAARFINLSTNLRTERSNSFTLSADQFLLKRDWQINLIAEGFFTQLNNPFINSNAEELANGISIVTKRNGTGSRVYGLNLELNAQKNNNILQSGITLQQARFEVEELLWENPNPSDNLPNTVTQNILRTPQTYGYANYQQVLGKNWLLNANLVYTGSMKVPHLINPENEYTVIKATPSFYEVGFKLTKTWQLPKERNVALFVGMYNVLNSYQRDFDRGALRDPGYIYGPNRPRTVYLGIRVAKL